MIPVGPEQIVMCLNLNTVKMVSGSHVHINVFVLQVIRVNIVMKQLSKYE